MALGDELSPWMIAPFVGLLLCIAILPLAAGEWFEKNRNKALVAALFGVPVVVYLAVAFGAEGRESLGETLHEYLSFIVLLTALFAISGGVYLSGDPLATPRNNITFLFVGAVLANFIGTTGAAMLLVRPVLRANAERTHMRHTVIFLDLHRLQHRRSADAARRSAALPRLSARRRLLLDPAPPAAVGDGRRSHAARLRGLRGARLPPRADAGGARRPRRVRADPRPGQAQRALPRRGDRRRPRLAAARRRRRGDRLPLPARGRHGGDDRPLAQGRSAPAARAEPLHLGPHPGGGDHLRRDLRRDDPGARHSRGARRRARDHAALAVLLGHGRRCRASSTTRRPTSRSRPRPRVCSGCPTRRG